MTKRILIILLTLLIFILPSCGKSNDPLDLELPPLDAEGLGAEALEEARQQTGWKMDSSGAFAYLELESGSVTPYFDETYDFNDNYFIYETTVGGEKMYGYMDTEFNKLSGALSTVPGVFMYNLARVQDSEGVYAIDTNFLPVDTYLNNYAKKGTTLIQVNWTNEPDETPDLIEEIDYDKYLVPVMQTSNMETGVTVEGRIWGYKTFNDVYIGNPNGETEYKIEPMFEDARGFFEGLAAVKLGGKWGFIDEDGDIVADFQFDRVANFSNGIARVYLKETNVNGNRVKERWSIIDNEGNLLSDFLYASIGEFEDGVAVANLATITKSSRFGSRTRISGVYLKADGQLLVDSITSGVQLQPFSEGFGIIRSSNSYKYIDIEGNQAVTGAYYSATNFSNGMAAVKKSRTSFRWGYIDISGTMAIEAEYTIAKPFDNGYAYVRDTLSQTGYLINKNGKKYLSELQLTGISKFNSDGYAIAYSETTEMQTMTNADTGESWEEEVQVTRYYMIHME